MSTSSQNLTSAIASDQEWLAVVRQKVNRLQFGSVQITVHDGRVSQVESVEKTRFVPKSRTDKNS